MKTPRATVETNYAFDAEDTFSISEFEFLMETIKEYTDKLRAQVEQAERQSMMFSAFLLGFGLSVAFAAMLPTSRSYRIDATSLDGQLLIAGTVFTSIGILMLLAQGYIRLKTSRLESERLSFILQRLIRRGSQISDRGQVTYGNRVMVDIILSDAENLVHRVKFRARNSILSKFSGIIIRDI